MYSLLWKSNRIIQYYYLYKIIISAEKQYLVFTHNKNLQVTWLNIYRAFAVFFKVFINTFPTSTNKPLNCNTGLILVIHFVWPCKSYQAKFINIFIPVKRQNKNSKVGHLMLTLVIDWTLLELRSFFHQGEIRFTSGFILNSFIINIGNSITFMFIL